MARSSTQQTPDRTFGRTSTRWVVSFRRGSHLIDTPYFDEDEAWSAFHAAGRDPRNSYARISPKHST